MEGVYRRMNIAFFTIVHNEDIFLDLWLRYYKKFSPNLFVINHDSAEEIIRRDRENHKFTEIQVSHDRLHDAGWMKEIVEEQQRKLLAEFDTVVYVEADEYLIVDPSKYKDLKDFIEKNKDSRIFATGYNVIQDEENEIPLDWQKPILKQRKYWSPTIPYSKPVITRVPINWVAGFHSTTDIPDDKNKPMNPSLILVHLRLADLDEHNNRRRVSGGGEDYGMVWAGRQEIPKKFKKLL